MAARGELGRYGEQIAAGYLHNAGMRILARNWRCADGEIDILARDGDTLVAVEVKTRSGRSHGTALEAVTPDKIVRLRALAVQWLRTRSEWFASTRVDVIALERFAGDFAIRHERGVS
jgi:putative endonuclease